MRSHRGFNFCRITNCRPMLLRRRFRMAFHISHFQVFVSLALILSQFSGRSEQERDWGDIRSLYYFDGSKFTEEALKSYPRLQTFMRQTGRPIVEKELIQYFTEFDCL